MEVHIYIAVFIVIFIFTILLIDKISGEILALAIFVGVGINYLIFEYLSDEELKKHIQHDDKMILSGSISAYTGFMAASLAGLFLGKESLRNSF